MTRYRKQEKKVDNMYQHLTPDMVLFLVRNYYLDLMMEEKSKKSKESESEFFELYIKDFPNAYLLGYSTALADKICAQYPDLRDKIALDQDLQINLLRSDIKNNIIISTKPSICLYDIFDLIREIEEKKLSGNVIIERLDQLVEKELSEFNKWSQEYFWSRRMGYKDS